MRARLGPRVSAISRGTVLGLAEHAQHVPAGQRREVGVAPAAVGQRREQARVAADVLEPVGQHVDAVVVAAEPDVRGAGHLADVLAVRDDVVEGRRRRGMGQRALVDEGVVRRVVGDVDPGHLAASLVSRSHSRTAARRSAARR